MIEVGITNQDLLQAVENEKKRKHDILANELGLMLQVVENEKKRKHDILVNQYVYEYRSKITPYVLTWDGVVTIYHKRYMNELGITPIIEE